MQAHKVAIGEGAQEQTSLGHRKTARRQYLCLHVLFPVQRVEELPDGRIS